jgi:hypothetical protein
MTFALVLPPTHDERPNFRIDPGALTANEASYLSGFRTADELRNRAAKTAISAYAQRVFSLRLSQRP